MARFTAQVGSFIRKSKERSEAIHKQAMQGLVEAANRPLAKGGRLPVDTGFLRNSLTGEVGSLPVGENKPDIVYNNGRKRVTNMPDGDDVILAIAKAEVGKTMYLGWTALYAIFMEQRYGFMESQAQRWQQHVDEAVRQAKARVK